MDFLFAFVIFASLPVWLTPVAQEPPFDLLPRLDLDPLSVFETEPPEESGPFFRTEQISVRDSELHFACNLYISLSPI